MAIIGYARVSTAEQSLDLQLDALNLHGCERCYTDHGLSRKTMKRTGLEKALNDLMNGDTFVVWRLDRLGRSILNLITFVETLKQKGVHLKSITEQIDTGSSGGKLFFHMLAALAEFERQLISERTVAGLHAAKARGSILGRPSRITVENLAEAKHLLDAGTDLSSAARKIGVSRRTLKKYLAGPAPSQAARRAPSPDRLRSVSRDSVKSA